MCNSQFRTTLLFWDCECEKDYIHPKTQNACGICGMTHDELSDSRVNEVIDQVSPDVIEATDNALPWLSNIDLRDYGIDWSLIVKAMRMPVKVGG